MRVKFLEGTRFEGKDFQRGQECDIGINAFYALGSSVEALEHPEAVAEPKMVSKPSRNKMVEAAPKNKRVKK
jgi:hypothetical protein